MNVITAERIEYMRKNPTKSRGELAETFGVSANAITNIRARYRIYFENPTLRLDYKKRNKPGYSNRNNGNNYSKTPNTSREIPTLKATPMLRFLHYILYRKSVSLTKTQYQTEIIIKVSEL